MIVNADITIFNKRYVRADRTEKFVGTVIKGVSWYSRTDTAAGSEETSDRDSYAIRIPVSADMGGKEYADPKIYADMDDETASGYWTLQPGAIIVRGISDAAEATETELKRAFREVVFITNFTDNRDRCSPAMRHWRIGGE